MVVSPDYRPPQNKRKQAAATSQEKRRKATEAVPPEIVLKKSCHSLSNYVACATQFMQLQKLFPLSSAIPPPCITVETASGKKLAISPTYPSSSEPLEDYEVHRSPVRLLLSQVDRMSMWGNCRAIVLVAVRSFLKQ